MVIINTADYKYPIRAIKHPDHIAVGGAGLCWLFGQKLGFQAGRSFSS